jgi:hypothetical protein
MSETLQQPQPITQEQIPQTPAETLGLLDGQFDVVRTSGQAEQGWSVAKVMDMEDNDGNPMRVARIVKPSLDPRHNGQNLSKDIPVGMLKSWQPKLEVSESDEPEKTAGELMGEIGLENGRFFVPRSSGEVDYGGWSADSITYDTEGNPEYVTIISEDPGGRGVMEKTVPVLGLLDSQVTPSGKRNIKAFRASMKIRGDTRLDEGIDQPENINEVIGAVPSLEELKTKESRLASELMKYELLAPADTVEVSGQSYGISRPIKTGNRSHAILWSESDGKVVPRMLYKSNSAGDWRVAYRVEPGGRYAKETTLSGRYHYTQENKLLNGILEKIGELEEDVYIDHDHVFQDYLSDTFSMRSDLVSETDTAEQEIKFDPKADEALRIFRSVSAGQLSAEETYQLRHKHGTMTEYFKSLDIEFEKQVGFVPDFSRGAIASMELEHPILGQYTVEDYDANLNGEAITWSMAEDQNGRTWIEGIKFKDATPTSYGTTDRIIDSGIITSKPLDYEHGTTGLLLGAESMPVPGSSYKDISPVLANLLPIRKYKERHKTN